MQSQVHLSAEKAEQRMVGIIPLKKKETKQGEWGCWVLWGLWCNLYPGRRLFSFGFPRHSGLPAKSTSPESTNKMFTWVLKRKLSKWVRDLCLRLEDCLWLVLLPKQERHTLAVSRQSWAHRSHRNPIKRMRLSPRFLPWDFRKHSMLPHTSSLHVCRAGALFTTQKHLEYNPKNLDLN